MIRRGLTFIELLLALALLSAVVAAVAAWIETSARTIAAVDGPMRWERAVGKVMRLIEEDLRRVSPAVIASRQEDTRSTVPVTIDVNRLVIPSPEISSRNGDRHGNEQEQFATYERDPTTKTLTRSLRDNQPRPLLDGVDAFAVTLSDDEPMLTVWLRSERGDEMQRRFILR